MLGEHFLMDKKMKIKEIIVVEGRDDTVAIQQAVEADTIETNGSAVSHSAIEQIKHAQEKRGVIIFTDPDYPGERIRNIITSHVKGCKHAFLSKEKARAKNGKGIGVEHASPAEIRLALDNVQYEFIEEIEEISWNELVDAGLIGDAKSKERRKRLGDSLKIGYTNGKQLHKRLKKFQITKEQFIEAYRNVLQEEVE